MTKLAKHIFFLFFVLCVGNAFGQRGPYRMGPPRPSYYNRPPNNQNPERRVENVKVNYLRTRLNLPSDQASKFFPLYQEYQQELFNVRKLKRQNNLNAADGQEQVNKELMYENEIVQIKIKFNNAFLKVLTPDKVSELYKSEREFNDELVRQLSERNNRPGPPQ
ncbi:hypothetical protein [Mucilaginibacter sp. L196]|uniref:hypothetical protein n=1 Tax=Mucilaginibacter sp. L196 TaxID=1641870 RepID=UPI00131AE3AD|nr:hypothetical protein [Mucilaginibacter sp. L196]